MYGSLTNSDKQLLQSAINSRVHVLKQKKRDLGTEHCAGLLCAKHCASGREALQRNIDQLHDIKRKLGIEKGYSQQPGSPYRDEPSRTETTEIDGDFVDFLIEVHVWEDDGGRCAL